jgi:hypothetical protein
VGLASRRGDTSTQCAAPGVTSMRYTAVRDQHLQWRLDVGKRDDDNDKSEFNWTQCSDRRGGVVACKERKETRVQKAAAGS